jgi:hypothetical protein
VQIVDFGNRTLGTLAEFNCQLAVFSIFLSDYPPIRVVRYVEDSFSELFK